jgi:hypothetical protein
MFAKSMLNRFPFFQRSSNMSSHSRSLPPDNMPRQFRTGILCLTACFFVVGCLWPNGTCWAYVQSQDTVDASDASVNPATTGNQQDKPDSRTTTQNTSQKPDAIPRPVKRARRPTLDKKDFAGMYFDNLFEEGLVGERPTIAELGAAQPRMATGGSKPPAATGSNAGDEAAPNEGSGWSSIIGPEVLENEIKRVQIALEAQITTPVQFQTDYLNVRDTFSMLSMWMAIIRDYEGSVRWQDQAAVAQATFARTAANCRVGSDAAYNSARAAQDKLRELVRGGSFDSTEKPEEDFEWVGAVDRNPIMRRLQASLDRLKQHVGSKDAFESESEEVLHDANLIAAMARVLADETMDGGDDEDYVSLVDVMLESAKGTADAVKLNNYDLSSTAVNQIEQSCNDCHAEYR